MYIVNSLKLKKTTVEQASINNILQVTEMGSYKMVINQTRQKKKRKREKENDQGSKSKKKERGRTLGASHPAIRQATEYEVKKDVQK